MTTTEIAPAVHPGSWYADWQHEDHAEFFDARARLSRADLIRNLEMFNDVRLLQAHVSRAAAGTLVEVGCATGEMCRYVALRYPALRYVGVDISEPAIVRAREKHPRGRFVVGHPGVPLLETLRRHGVAQPPELLYAKDVVHHQIQPFEFLEELVTSATHAVILRLRTRDVGATVLDPEQSCQYHYNGWMPYIVMNLEEIIARIRQAAPQSEMVVCRHHMVLGGRLNRFLPKACYLPDTGTAETAVGVFLRSPRPGAVTIEDRVDGQASRSPDFRLARLAGRVWRSLTRSQRS